MCVHDLTTEDGLDRVLDEHEIVVIDFWAPWCLPCKEFVPLFEAAAAEHPEMAFCSVNTQNAGALAAAFEVEQVPTLIVVRQRIMLASQLGCLSEDNLRNLLHQVRELDMDALREEMAVTEATGKTSE